MMDGPVVYKTACIISRSANGQASLTVWSSV